MRSVFIAVVVCAIIASPTATTSIGASSRTYDRAAADASAAPFKVRPTDVSQLVRPAEPLALGSRPAVGHPPVPVLVLRFVVAAKAGDDLARATFDRGRRLERLADAGTPVGRVRNLDVPDPGVAARRVADSLTRGPNVTSVSPRSGVTVYRLPEGGQVVLRSPTASRSRLWAVDVHGVPGYSTIRTHFR